jgi:hypothetical protein
MTVEAMIEIVEPAENKAEAETSAAVKAGKHMRVRMMEPRDLPRVWSAARAQNRRDGTSYPVPPIYDLDETSPLHGHLLPNVALALVTEVDGRVRQGHVFLRTIEEMSFGGGAAEMDFSGRHIPLALEMLKRRGYNDLHVLVPHARVGDLRDMLEREGLSRIDQRLAHFFKML